MLFNQEDFCAYDPIQEAADILNESVYLTEEESMLNVNTVPVIENNRLGVFVVNFSDIESFSEDHDIDYIDSMQAIAEANDISMDELAVSVPEWKVIANPEIVNEMSNVVIAPPSYNDSVSLLIDAGIDMALEEDFSIIENIDSILMETDLLLEILDTEKGRQSFLHAFEKRYGKKTKNKKLENIIEKLRNSIALMQKDPNANQAEIEARLRQLKKQQEKLNKLNGDSSDEEGNPKKAGHARIFRRMADDEKLGLGGEENTDKRVEYRKKARDLETKRKNAYAKKQAKAAEDKKAKREAEVKAMPFVKRVLARIHDSSPVQAIINAVNILKTKLNEIKAKAEQTPEDERSLFQKVIVFISNAINRLTEMIKKKKESFSNKNKESGSENNNKKTETNNQSNNQSSPFLLAAPAH